MRMAVDVDHALDTHRRGRTLHVVLVPAPRNVRALKAGQDGRIDLRRRVDCQGVSDGHTSLSVRLVCAAGTYRNMPFARQLKAAVELITDRSREPRVVARRELGPGFEDSPVLHAYQHSTIPVSGSSISGMTVSSTPSSIRQCWYR
jgi:hypothetical protein